MFLHFVQTIIPRQQLTTKVRQHSAKQPSVIDWTAMADGQSDFDTTTTQNNLPQLHAVSSGIQT
jgi:hypothetical protein